jgi:hypothetical protein
MKACFAPVLLALLTTVAAAQTPQLGMFFSATEFSDDMTNFDGPANVPFEAYVVLLGAEVATVGGYALGMWLPPNEFFVIETQGPHGWTNSGTADNHLCAYDTPLPVSAEGTVLSSMTCLFTSDYFWVIEFGPSDPPGMEGHPGPAIIDGQDGTSVIAAWVLGGDLTGPVATLNDPFPPATAGTSLSRVKSLFR